MVFGNTMMYHIAVDDYNQSIIIDALNDKRNKLLADGKDTEPIDDLILLVYRSPRKRVKVIEKRDQPECRIMIEIQ